MRWKFSEGPRTAWLLARLTARGFSASTDSITTPLIPRCPSLLSLFCLFYTLIFFLYKVCSIRIVTSKLDVKTVSFLPKDVVMEEKLELTMYIIQKWMLVRDVEDQSGQASVKFIVVLERRIMSELLGTYLPTFLLVGITFSTTFFKAEYFEASVASETVSVNGYFRQP